MIRRFVARFTFAGRDVSVPENARPPLRLGRLRVDRDGHGW